MNQPRPRLIAVAPDTRPEMHEAFRCAVTDAGGIVASLAEAEGLIWADPAAADRYPETIAQAPHVRWIQLPYAGIEPFADHLDQDHIWTCGKETYADPVAEHVLALLLGGFRNVIGYARAKSWSGPKGRNLRGANITILGGGGITESLLKLLEPWGCAVTVVRRQAVELEGATQTVTVDRLDDTLVGADAVVIALALTPETRGIINARTLSLMEPHAWLINVARGGHVVTADLIDALQRNLIDGAALDVTDPEPLPPESPLWDLENCLITPHVGNTPVMGLPLIAGRVRDNVSRFVNDQPLAGLVDPLAKY